MPKFKFKSLIRSYLTTSIIVSASIAMLSTTTAHAISKDGFMSSYSNRNNIHADYIPLLYSAEVNASPQGRAVLRQARIMGLDKKISGKNIGRGSCWDYLNKVFNDSGFSSSKRKDIFSGKYAGPFVKNLNIIKEGDWLYFINHSYNRVEHSGLFVGWVNKKNKMALVFSYGGQGKDTIGKYTIYDLSNVYNIMRPVGKGNGNFKTQRTNRSHITSPTPKRVDNKKSTSTKRSTVNVAKNSQAQFIQKHAKSENVQEYRKQLPVIYKANQQSKNAGKKVVGLVQKWTLETPKIIKGTSAHYVAKVFDNARVKQNVIFKSEYPKGPFYKNSSFKSNDLKAGDWLSFVNLGYKNSEHDGIFIGWENGVNNKAVILSYGGENRQSPARYRTYDVSNIYTVVRPK